MVLRARIWIVHAACIDDAFSNPSWFALNIFMRWMLSLVPSFANVLGALILSWASEFDHVCLTKPQPKLLFIVVILISFTLISSCCSSPLLCRFSPASRIEHIPKYISIKNLWTYLSNKWSFALNGVQTRELWPFYFSAACCPENFRVHDLRCFGHNFLWETSIDLILDLLEPELRGKLQFSSEVEQNIDDNNDFLRIDPKMSMILILWSSERLVVHPWLQGHHHWFTSE